MLKSEIRPKFWRVASASGPFESSCPLHIWQQTDSVLNQQIKETEIQVVVQRTSVHLNQKNGNSPKWQIILLFFFFFFREGDWQGWYAKIGMLLVQLKKSSLSGGGPKISIKFNCVLFSVWIGPLMNQSFVCSRTKVIRRWHFIIEPQLPPRSLNTFYFISFKIDNEMLRNRKFL